MWRVLQGHNVEGYTGATTAPVEDPPDLKNLNRAILIISQIRIFL
jgi:hypothetical protein